MLPVEGGARRYPPHLSPDSLRHVFSYGDATSLIAARGACRVWRGLADESPAWRWLCAELWHDKQNHPVEQWVRLPVPLPDPEDAVRDQVELLLLLQLFTGGTLRNSSALAMDMLNLTRIVDVDRKAAPISHVLREQQIELENQLRRLRPVSQAPSSSQRDLEYSKLSKSIITNISSPLVVAVEDRERFQSEGRLLSWHESYLASMEDSRRTCITYEVALRPH